MAQSFEEAREYFWKTIHVLKRKKTLSAVHEARQMLRDWMRQYPDDYYSQDAGESLAMMEDALGILEAEKSAQPVAA